MPTPLIPRGMALQNQPAAKTKASDHCTIPHTFLDPDPWKCIDVKKVDVVLNYRRVQGETI